MPRDLHDRVVPAFFYVRARPLRMPPGRAIDTAPPLAAEHALARDGGLARGGKVTEKHKRPAETLRLGAVAGGVDEGVELLVGDRGFVDVERTQRDLVRRPLAVIGETIVAVVAHQKHAAGQQAHAGGGAARHTAKFTGARDGRGGGTGNGRGGSAGIFRLVAPGRTAGGAFGSRHRRDASDSG